MPNTIYKTWVECVNNWRVVASIKEGYISTNKPTSLHTRTINWAQRQFTQLTSPYFYHAISTYLKPESNPLNKSFTHYPQHLLLELINEI